jgi:hypothetical protein
MNFLLALIAVAGLSQVEIRKPQPKYFEVNHLDQADPTLFPAFDNNIDLKNQAQENGISYTTTYLEYHITGGHSSIDRAVPKNGKLELQPGEYKLEWTQNYKIHVNGNNALLGAHGAKKLEWTANKERSFVVKKGYKVSLGPVDENQYTPQ